MGKLYHPATFYLELIRVLFRRTCDFMNRFVYLAIFWGFPLKTKHPQKFWRKIAKDLVLRKDVSLLGRKTKI